MPRNARLVRQRSPSTTQALETLRANLGYGAADAIEEYVSLVFANSAYPADFPVEHDFEFDPATAELRLKVLVPGPDKVPSTNAYKYAKSADEITCDVPVAEGVQGPVRGCGPPGGAALAARGVRGRSPRAHQDDLA